MNDRSSELEKARPLLKQVVPLTATICWIFAWVNVALGLGFLFLFDQATLKTPLFLISKYIPAHLWGHIFLILAVIMIYGLKKNSWLLVRRMMLAGLIVKSIWFVQLVFRTIDNPSTILWASVWFAFMAVQAAVYIHFMPGLDMSHGGVQDGE